MNNYSIADMKRELLERDNYTPAELESMSALEIVSAWQELPATEFGIVKWSDEDIVAAYEEQDIIPTDEDIRAIREACNARVYGICEAMIEAGWEYIYAAIRSRVSELEAIERRARAEELYDRTH